MKKILFIANHRKDRAPGQRFRFEQYFDFLQNNGYQCELSYIITEKDDKIFYSKGEVVRKIYIAVKAFYKRLFNILNISQYDIIFIYLEAFMTGTVFFEKLFSNSKAKIVFDFDDAIWLQYISEANKIFRWLKNPYKTAKIISLADMVFAGNNYLADYARQYANNVKIVPTTINTAEYIKIEPDRKDDRICIGWSGSFSTIQHFEYAILPLKKIKDKYKNSIYFKVIGDGNYRNKELGIKGIPWSKKNEVKELSSIDIGIMPLPDNEWNRGKCGLKGLQYMALEIPTIMSPVGVNSEIIQDGKNGFLADSMENWVDKLTLLIESKKIRKKIGKAGRKTVLKKYSTISQRKRYLNLFNEVCN